MRSCSNFFCWSALRCSQLSLTIDWRSALFYLASRIQVAHLVLSCVLFGSMAKLLFSLSMQSVLAPCSWFIFLIGKMILSMVIVLALKSSTIPYSFMVLVPRMRSYFGLLPFLYSTASFPFSIRVFEQVQLHPSSMLSPEDPFWSIPQLWNQPFWVWKQYGFVFAHKDKDDKCLTGPALFMLIVHVIVVAVVSILEFTPHYCYHCIVLLPSGGS